jgi:hypothetical protein
MTATRRGEQKVTDKGSRLAFSVVILLAITGILSAQTIPDSKVRYISAGTVYLDRGGNAGLKVGDRLDVMRNQKILARVEITYIATASASCKIISQQSEIRVGDIAHWIESTKEEAAADTVTAVRTRVIPEKKTSDKTPAFRTYISGGVSVQMYRRIDNSPAAFDFNQYNARLTLRIRNLWTEDLNVNINTRARFDHRVSAFGTNIPEEEWRNRLYWISVAYEPSDAPLNFQIGRIASGKFSGFGYLDGLLLQHNISKAFSWGLFGGVQPDMTTIDFSTSMQKYGLYGTYRSGAYSGSYLQTTLAFVGSYTSGTVNREYAYFELRMNDRSGWRLDNSIELDYNRSWRRDYAGTIVSLTGLYLAGSYKFNERITAGLGYDNRQNYLTYAYYSLPQEMFDEAQRQYLRGDVQVNFPVDLTIAVRGGLREGQGDRRMSYNYGVSLVKSNLFRQFVQLNMAFSGFRTLYNNGLTPSASLRYQMGPVSAGVAYGAYSYSIENSNRRRLNQYLNASFSIPVWSGIYLFGNYYYDWGDDMQGHRILTELGYRF